MNPGTHPSTSTPGPTRTTSSLEVFFASSGVRITTDGQTPLLDLAEEHGLRLEYGCRSGSCGVCKVLCRDGQVFMDDPRGLNDADERAGYVLTCTGCPLSNLILEA